LTDVHPSAVVDPRALLADDVSVGPYAVVGPHVELAPGVELGPHVHVTGHTRVGARTRIFPFASVGEEPMDKKFAGETTRLEIGCDNVIREHATLHVGTEKGGGVTRIGDDNLVMNGAHVAHDCQVASHTILASFCGLAGHVEVGDYAVLGAYTGVHQFSRVGESVMTAANTMLAQDAPPFALMAGDRARLAGVNAVGLKRRGFPPDVRRAIKHAYHVLFASRLPLAEAVARLRREGEPLPEVARLLRFLETSERGIAR
jgi:UDP-N-acetylglucosamine acyltransferase